MSVCIDCGENYNPKRAALGYKTCLECGNHHAKKEILRKAEQVAPIYNKGGYQYITPSVVKDLGK